MAAATKMDELLVNWMGSDEVYENVMNLIEKYREQRQQVAVAGGGGGGATTATATSGANAGTNPSNGSNSNTTSNSNSNSRPNSPTNTHTHPHANTAEKSLENPELSPRGVVIPPFYPLQTFTGTKVPRRRQLPRQAETWEPLPEPFLSTLSTLSTATMTATATATATTNPSTPAVPTAPTSSKHLPGTQVTPTTTTTATATTKSTAASTATPTPKTKTNRGHNDDLPDDEQQDQQTTGAANASSALCVRDQVHNLLPDLVITKTLRGEITFSLESFIRITKEICNFPSFFNGPLYQRIIDLWNVAKNQTAKLVSLQMLEWFWKTEMEPYDPPERFFRLVKQPQNDCILRDDFLPYIKALLNDHPGLEFLSNHAEFQEKYAVTVITRIFYSVNKCHSGRITSRQVRRSDLLQAFASVDEEEDINKVTRYFSYEHFYVLYCRFWELDHDRDYRITREDLLKYGDHSLSHMIVDRIFDAAPRPFGQEKIDREYLSYEDFIYFMLSEEDKANDVSVRYWFTCVDVDGDAKLNNMEMRSFYAVQLHRMQCMGHEIVPFEDMLCQMMDMIKPKHSDCLVVEDFLQPECSQVSGALFDALFNLNKYLMFEQRDPFVERQKREDEFETDWDRFACIDYNRLAMEEEAREEEAMEIDWVTVDDEDEANPGGRGEYAGAMSTEAPF